MPDHALLTDASANSGRRMSLPASVLLLAWLAAGPMVAEPLSKAKLLQLAGSVDEAVVVQLVQRDCVDFELTADTVVELAPAIPKSVLSAAISCRQQRTASPATGVDLTAQTPSTLVVLPFSGTADFRTLSTETLSAFLLGRTSLQIMQPEALGTKQVYVTADPATGSFSISEAQRVGAVVRAQFAVMGDINAQSGGGMLNAVATIKLVDVASGSVMFSSQKKCGLLIANSQQQCVIRAVKRAAEDLLPKLPRKR